MAAGSHLGSLHLLCRAEHGQEERALQLRRRLESTARVHLPEALERALERDGRHVFADRVDVRLDFDPGDYDDVTLATLWAARVAAAIDAAGAEAGVLVYASQRELYGAAASQWADSGGLGPQFETLGCGTGPRVGAPALLAAFDTRERLAALAVVLTRRAGRLERVRLRLAAREREAVLAALSGERRWGDWEAGVGRRAAAGHGAPVGEARAEPEPARDRSSSGWSQTAGAGADAAPRPAPWEKITPKAWAAAWRRCASDRAAAVRFGPAATLRGDDRGGSGAEAGAPEARAQRELTRAKPDLDRGLAPRDRAAHSRAERPRKQPNAPAAWLTRYAGLVLLYPWLESHLSGGLPPAEAPPGSPPETGGRMWALAALAEPGPEAQAVLDPLVRALAGADPARDLQGWRPEPPPLLAELREPAEALLARFAQALPGFAGSSPEYIRREFLERGGSMEPDGDGVLTVRLEPAPLDLALDRLPYPLAPFGLPWSPTFVPSLRGDHA